MENNDAFFEDENLREGIACAARGDAAGAAAALTVVMESGWYFPEGSVEERLLGEALDCARGGNADDTAHRLRLLTDPKFGSRAECQRRYDVAMAEKSAAEAAEVFAFDQTPLGGAVTNLKESVA